MRMILAVALASTLLLAGAAARGQAPTLVRVGVEADDGSTPLLWARSSGLFARAGLNVDVERLPSSAAATAAIGDGKLEIARASTFALVIAHDRNQAFSAIATAGSYRSDQPDAAVVVVRSSTLARGRDFTGKAIGVAAVGDFDTLATQAWLDKDRAGAAQFVEVPPAGVGAALDGGRITGAVLSEPALALTLNSGKYRVAGKIYDGIAPRFAESLYFARTDWIIANRDTVDRFIAVMREANAYVAAHASETVAPLAAFIGVEPGALAQMARPARPANVDPAELAPVIAAVAHYQLITKAFPAETIVYPGALAPVTGGRIR